MNSEAQLVEGAPRASLHPRLRIEIGDFITVEGRCQLVQQRQKDKLVLVDTENNELRVITDAEARKLHGDGALEYRSRLQRREPLSPLAPTVLSEERRKGLEHKHAYVQYVIKHPDGYRKSKPWIAQRIREYAQSSGDPSPPSPGSVINWKALHDADYQEIGLAAYAPRHDLKGKRGSKLVYHQKQAIEAGLDRYLEGGTAKDAYVEVQQQMRAFNQSREGRLYRKVASEKFLDRKGQLKTPSLSTFEREIRKVSPAIRDAGRVGTYFARKKYSTFQKRALAQRPYEEVEIDFTPVDLLLVADNATVLGRPHLVVLLDRATRMILGFSVSFDVPSYAAVLEGLRNAIYPKAIDHIDGLRDEDWPCRGRIDRLYIDNGREFANGHLLNAASDLGFEIHRLAPREPWLKGSVERFFRDVAGFAHMFPGTTHSNAVEHRDYEANEDPVLTLSEFRDLFTKWVVEVYHQRPNRMLGRVPGVGRSPIDAWRDKLVEWDCPRLPKRQLFIALAGEHQERTIQKDGVVWDHIQYSSPKLDFILAHPDHKLKSNNGVSALYSVHRDPYDLSKIFLFNHHANEVLELPVVDRWADYANGLTVYQHRLCREDELIREEQRGDPEALSKARAKIIAAARGTLRSGGRKKIERRMTRFLYGKSSMPLISEIKAVAAVSQSGEEPMPLSSAIEEPTIALACAETDALAHSSEEFEPKQGHLRKSDKDDLDEIYSLASSVKSGKQSHD